MNAPFPSIPELHADEELRRREFPVAARSAFLAHAGVCPVPRRVAEACAGFAAACAAADQEAAIPPGLVGATRRLAAGLIGAREDEISFVGPTSSALSRVAAGLQVKRGQNVLVYHDCYPSNVYPWMALADRGVEVRFMNIRELGRIRVVDVQGQIDEDTRLVALASAHYLTGWRIPVEAIGRMLRQRGVLFCLDAIQTLGAFPLRAEHVDILAADAHKWLLGPCAAGILHVREEARVHVLPVEHGWHNVQGADFLTQDEPRFHEGGRRYEAGTHNFLGLVGLRAALEIVSVVGVGAIAAEIARQRLRLVAALSRLGWDVLHGDVQPENAGGIASFHREGEDMAAVHARLLRAGVVTSLRVLPGGRRVVRVSPHFYNTDAEIDRLLGAL
jgi:selenocysteine lyase/cysteine desulfurase